MQDKYVLPLVDISLLNSPNLDDHMQVAQALDQACKEVGFLYLKGDQFQPALFAQLCDIAEHYFAQDDALKMQNYIGKSVNHSGYVPIGEELKSDWSSTISLFCTGFRAKRRLF